MALSPGDRLGPYQILGAIGAGGMGKVLSAVDFGDATARAIDSRSAVAPLPGRLMFGLGRQNPDWHP